MRHARAKHSSLPTQTPGLQRYPFFRPLAAWPTVVSGCLFTVDSVTNRPVFAERCLLLFTDSSYPTSAPGAGLPTLPYARSTGLGSHRTRRAAEAALVAHSVTSTIAESARVHPLVVRVNTEACSRGELPDRSCDRLWTTPRLKRLVEASTESPKLDSAGLVRVEMECLPSSVRVAPRSTRG